MSSLLEESLPERNSIVTHEPAKPDTRTFGRTILGKQTDLVITKFASRDIIVLTQLRKLGSVIEISQDTVRNSLEGSTGRSVFSVNTLLGQESEDVNLFGRVLAEKLNIRKPILLTLGIKQFDHTMIRPLIEFVEENF